MPLLDELATRRALRTQAMYCMRVAGVVAMIGGVWSAASLVMNIFGEGDRSRQIGIAALGAVEGAFGWALFRKHAALAGSALTLIAVFHAFRSWARTGSLIGLGVGAAFVLVYGLGWRGAATYSTLASTPDPVPAQPEAR